MLSLIQLIRFWNLEKKKKNCLEIWKWLHFCSFYLSSFFFYLLSIHVPNVNNTLAAQELLRLILSNDGNSLWHGLLRFMTQTYCYCLLWYRFIRKHLFQINFFTLKSLEYSQSMLFASFYASYSWFYQRDMCMSLMSETSPFFFF